MSAIVSASTPKWYWTDDLARALAESGRQLSPPEWLQAPFAIRGAGDPLEVAEALLQEATFAA